MKVVGERAIIVRNRGQVLPTQHTTMIINEEILRTKAPAVFATYADVDRVSDRYRFLPTTEVIETLQDDGWEAWDASTVKSRKWNPMTAKHMVRMRRREEALQFGDSQIEMLIINSHNGIQSYNLHGGIFRLVCSNGMVISSEDYGMVKIPHIGWDKADILQASQDLVANTNRIVEKVDGWKSTELSDTRRNEFFTEAARLRWDDPSIEVVANTAAARRPEDQGNDLWRTFNVAQENLIRGGFVDSRTRRKARVITSISKDIELNTQLWDLASNFANN